jgi:hypothetical protein
MRKNKNRKKFSIFFIEKKLKFVHAFQTSYIPDFTHLPHCMLAHVYPANFFGMDDNHLSRVLTYIKLGQIEL